MRSRVRPRANDYVWIDQSGLNVKEKISSIGLLRISDDKINRVLAIVCNRFVLEIFSGPVYPLHFRSLLIYIRR